MSTRDGVPETDAHASLVGKWTAERGTNAQRVLYGRPESCLAHRIARDGYLTPSVANFEYEIFESASDSHPLQFK